MSFSGTKGYITKPNPGVMLNPLHPLSRGLVGYWLFNEGAGSLANDISGHANNGILKNMSSNTQGSGWGGSKFGGGLEFDGSDDYVNCGNDGSLDILGNITLGCWIKTDDVTTSSYTIGKTNTDTGAGYGIIILNSRFYYKYGGGFQYSNAVLTTKEWQHIVVVWNGTNSFFYRNGVLDKSNSGGNPSYIELDLAIGQRGVGSGYFNGFIDLVHIYNRALSAEEVKQLYQDQFCNLLQVPIRRYFDIAPPVGAIMNQFQGPNLGADLFNGTLL